MVQPDDQQTAERQPEQHPGMLRTECSDLIQAKGEENASAANQQPNQNRVNRPSQQQNQMGKNMNAAVDAFGTEKDADTTEMFHNSACPF